MPAENKATPYDEVFYPCTAYPQTHPDLLATQAVLFGMDPPDVRACRVLEIGCGDGTNVVSMAHGLPGSRFLGIDLADRPLARGRDLVDRLGLDNVSLVRADLLELPPDPEPFDYIIAHGLYTWVPSPVRDGLLEVCRTRLSRNGVAFVSYNCYPGAHLRTMLRDMMLFHVHAATDPAARIGQARAFLQFLATAHREADEIVQLLRKEVAQLTLRSPDALYHDDLASVNQPVYFHEFVRHAAAHGLQYLAEAEASMMQDGGLSDEARGLLRGVEENRLLREQYLDFVRLRRFRRTLLCHGEVAVRNRPDPAAVPRLRSASSARRVDGATDGPWTFQHDSGGRVVCGDPLSKAVMTALVEAWPRSLPFDELLAAVQAPLPGGPPADASALVSALLLRAHGLGVVELRLHEPRFACRAGDRPACSRLARAQVAHGDVVTNLRHAPVRIEDEATRRMMLLLDGSTDRPRLAAEFRRIQPGGPRLDDLLERLGRLALLLPEHETP